MQEIVTGSVFENILKANGVWYFTEIGPRKPRTQNSENRLAERLRVPRYWCTSNYLTTVAKYGQLVLHDVVVHQVLYN